MWGIIFVRKSYKNHRGDSNTWSQTILDRMAMDGSILVMAFSPCSQHPNLKSPKHQTRCRTSARRSVSGKLSVFARSTTKSRQAHAAIAVRSGTRSAVAQPALSEGEDLLEEVSGHNRQRSGHPFLGTL